MTGKLSQQEIEKFKQVAIQDQIDEDYLKCMSSKDIVSVFDLKLITAIFIATELAKRPRKKLRRCCDQITSRFQIEQNVSRGTGCSSSWRK